MRDAVDVTSGYPPFTSAAQFLYEDSPGANWNRASYQVPWASGVPARVTVLNGNNRPLADVVALVEGANVAVNAALGEVQRLTLTSNSNRAIQTPTNGRQGQLLTFEILNSSGAAYTSTKLTFTSAYLKTAAFPSTNIACGGLSGE